MEPYAAENIAWGVLSLNQWQRLHWGKRSRIKKQLVMLVRCALGEQKTPPREKVRVVITSHRKRQLDYDNLVGGCKPLVDALTQNNLIADDSPEAVEIDYKQKIDGKAEPFTRVEFYEIEDHC